MTKNMFSSVPYLFLEKKLSAYEFGGICIYEECMNEHIDPKPMI
jgi:hypothetical protein